MGEGVPGSIRRRAGGEEVEVAVLEGRHPARRVRVGQAVPLAVVGPRFAAPVGADPAQETALDAPGQLGRTA